MMNWDEGGGEFIVMGREIGRFRVDSGFLCFGIEMETLDSRFYSYILHTSHKANELIHGP